MLSIICSLLNSAIFILIAITILIAKRKNASRLDALEADFEKLKTEAKERNEVLDSSKCYQAAKYELQFKKHGENPFELLKQLKSLLGDETVKLSVTGVNYSSPTFSEDIKALDKKDLGKILNRLKELEEFRLVNIVQRELEARGE